MPVFVLHHRTARAIAGSDSVWEVSRLGSRGPCRVPLSNRQRPRKPAERARRRGWPYFGTSVGKPAPIHSQLLRAFQLNSRFGMAVLSNSSHFKRLLGTERGQNGENRRQNAGVMPLTLVSCTVTGGNHVISSINNPPLFASTVGAISGRTQASEVTAASHAVAKTVTRETGNVAPNGQPDAAAQLRDVRGLMGTELGFRIGDNLDHVLVVFLQRDTGEVIREIPVKGPFLSRATLDAIRSGPGLHVVV